MMMRILLVAILSACAFADRVTFNVSCAYHYAVQFDGTGPLYNYYGMLNSIKLPMYQLYDADESKTLVRCDIMEDSSGYRCLTISSGSKCLDDHYENLASPGLFEKFFDSEPDPVECPHKDCVSPCKMYVTLMENYTVDSYNHVVQIASSRGKNNYIWYDDVPAVTKFAGTKCDNITALPDPVDICSTKKVEFDVKCAYHFALLDGPYMREVYGMRKGNKHLYEFQHSNDEGDVWIRCDITNEFDQCYCVFLKPKCVNQYESGNDYFNVFDFEYDYGPVQHQCPQTSNATNCQEFCIYEGFTKVCVVMDVEKRLPLSLGKDYQVVWYEDEPTVDKFTTAMCNTTMLPPAVDICPHDVSSLPPSSLPSGSVGSASVVKATVTIVIAVLAIALL